MGEELRYSIEPSVVLGINRFETESRAPIKELITSSQSAKSRGYL